MTPCFSVEILTFTLQSIFMIHSLTDREQGCSTLSLWCNITSAHWQWLISQYAPCESRQAPGLIISHLSPVHCSRGRLGPIKTRVLTHIFPHTQSFITQWSENELGCNGHNQTQYNQSHTRLFSSIFIALHKLRILSPGPNVNPEQWEFFTSFIQSLVSFHGCYWFMIRQFSPKNPSEKYFINL